MAEDFSEKLSSILGNSEAMGQIMAMAQSLGGGKTEPSHSAPAGASSAEVNPTDDDAAGGGGYTRVDWEGNGENFSPEDATHETHQSTVLPDFGGLDPRLLSLGMQLLSAYNDASDGKAELLHALRPFLKESRSADIDKAIQLAKMARVGHVAYDLWKQQKKAGDALV